MDNQSTDTTNPTPTEPIAPQMPYMPEPSTEPPQTLEPAKKRRSKKTFIFSLIIILLLVAGGAAYWWRDSQANQQRQADASRISSLETTVEQLQTSLNQDQPETTAPTAIPSDAAKQTIESALGSKKYDSLTDLLAAQVSVVTAGDDATDESTVTQRSAAQAMTDLAFFDTATKPWGFNLSDERIDSFDGTGYTSYFNDNSYVGESANHMVVSFNFDETGKINGIFMAASAAAIID